MLLQSTIAHPSQIAMSAPVTSSSAFVHSFRGVPSTGKYSCYGSDMMVSLSEKFSSFLGSFKKIYMPLYLIY